MSLAAKAAARTPEEALQEFYSWVLASRENKKSSLPTANEQKKLATVLSPRLMKLIAEVERAEQRCFESVKGSTDKPYFFETDVFVGNWGGADEVTYGKLESKNGRATVNVTHFSINKNVAKADAARVEVWVNRVDLRANGSVWVIHDLRYGSGSTLSSRFSDYLSNSKKWCRS